MKKPESKFSVGQPVKLRNQPTTRHAVVENVVGFIRKQWLYQVSYQIVDEVSPNGSDKRYSQPFNESEIEQDASRDYARLANAKTHGDTLAALQVLVRRSR